MVRYNGLLNPFYSLNLSRLFMSALSAKTPYKFASHTEALSSLMLGFVPQPNLRLFHNDSFLNVGWVRCRLTQHKLTDVKLRNPKPNLCLFH